MKRRIAAGLYLSALPTMAEASGDPAVLLLPLGMLLSLPAVVYFASRSSPNWPIRVAVAVLGIAAMAPAAFLKGDAFPITYFILGFAPATLTAYIASRLFRLRKPHAT